MPRKKVASLVAEQSPTLPRGTAGLSEREITTMLTELWRHVENLYQLLLSPPSPDALREDLKLVRGQLKKLPKDVT